MNLSLGKKKSHEPHGEHVSRPPGDDVAGGTRDNRWQLNFTTHLGGFRPFASGGVASPLAGTALRRGGRIMSHNAGVVSRKLGCMSARRSQETKLRRVVSRARFLDVEDGKACRILAAGSVVSEGDDSLAGRVRNHALPSSRLFRCLGKHDKFFAKRSGALPLPPAFAINGVPQSRLFQNCFAYGARSHPHGFSPIANPYRTWIRRLGWWFSVCIGRTERVNGPDVRNRVTFEPFSMSVDGYSFGGAGGWASSER